MTNVIVVKEYGE